MDSDSNIDPIVAAIAADLGRINPGCTIGSVLVSAEIIDGDGNLVYGFMNNGVGTATETMLISVRLQALAHESLQALPEEPD